MPNTEPLITKKNYFPRSEYYTRFEGTTAFDMDNPEYWSTYHRSESSRFFTRAGGRKGTQFSSPCIKKSADTHSFSAHSGGYHTPFSLSLYSKDITLETMVGAGKINVRDHLLLYKNTMVKEVVKHFESLQDNEQQVGSQQLRPIVYTENAYPCVLIQLPVINRHQTKTKAARYWAKHPKSFQKLLLSSLLAYINAEALEANIPIEMVLRASFGHNLPSICETNNTFRINVGIIPKVYAELIGKALYKLNKSISAITDSGSLPLSFDEPFIAQVRKYNAIKLKGKISTNDRYKKLRNTDAFKRAATSDSDFENLYSQFCKINSKKTAKGGSRFKPVNFKDKTIWQAIRQAGDSMGKPVLSECFRQKGTEDWFANQVMELLLAKHKKPIEAALHRLLNCLSYGKTASMNYGKIHSELKGAKRKFAQPSFEPLYKSDPAFSQIVEMLCEALLVKRPKQALYAVLDRAGNKLFTTYKASKEITDDFDFGSDSEFSDDYEDYTKPKTKFHVSHSKLRVCSGMKAILVAQYGALSYLKSQGAKTFSQEVEQMYYEVEDALKLVTAEEITINKVRAKKDSIILHYDLNHCNSSNTADNKKLKEKLATLKPSIVILDYTSSTVSTIRTALQECFSDVNVKLVIYVNSGLKNDQGGDDLNPYGEVRVCARDKATTKNVLTLMRKGLSPKDKLSQETHEMVRICKKRGLAPSFYGAFHSRTPRFQIVKAEKNEQSVPRQLKKV